MTLLNLVTAAAIGLLGVGVDGAAVRRSSDYVVSTYFAGFHANRGFPVSAMPWEKYTDVKYAFAETTPNGTLDLSRSAPDQLPVFVEAAKKAGVKPRVSIGGWTGSRYFSENLGSPENRTTFVKACVDLVNQYGLEGLDIDWEYPNRQGLGCNAINVNDTANLLAFLQELRQTPEGKSLLLTAAASLYPWNDATGSRSKDLKAFADVLDYVMIMNYDVHGPWLAYAGPNAPLYLSCDARNNQGAGDDGISQWIAAGVPSNKIVLGVPAYGHGFSVNASSALYPNGTLNLYPTQNGTNRFQGSSWDTDPPIDDCGNAQPPGGTYTFWSLITEAKFLTEQGKPAKGNVYGWDSCSQTPAIWNKEREIYVSYDNAESFAAKGKYVINKDLRGFAMYEAGGDHNNILINAIRKSVGLV